MDCKIILKIFIFFFIVFLFPAKSVEFKGKFIQGHFILGQTEPGAKILIDKKEIKVSNDGFFVCLLYTSPSPRDATLSRMPSSA